MNQITRREMLKCAALLSEALYLRSPLLAADEKPKKILFFTKSSGYQHSVVKRNGKDLAFAEKILIDTGKAKGFDVVASKDGGLFTSEKLDEFDAFVFYTTGDLATAGTDKQPPMPQGGKQALLDAVNGGKGFVGIHCATDTFHGTGDEIDPYIKMIGGEFVRHGQQQDSTCHLADTKFPGLPDKDITLHEEWYTMKHFAPDLHVILLQETQGMKGDAYKRPAYPSTWARMHGKGRVFYTSIGHREDVWTNPIYTNLLMGGINWATGNVSADITADIDTVAPGVK